MSALFTVSWLLSSFLMNILQLIIFITIKPIHRQLYRKLNYYLTYSTWSQVVAVAENFSNFKLRMYFKDQQSFDQMGKQHTIAISNHAFEVDWIFLWMVVDKFYFLAGARAFVKQVIKFFPVIGWSFYFNEFIFLARDWNKDSKSLGRQLDTLAEYPHPLMLLLFCEGTRLTPEKYAASLEFAKERNIDHFKHHLVPRPKGFVYCISHIKEKLLTSIPAIYNVQVAFSSSLNQEVEPNVSSLMYGQQLIGDVYLERIPIESIAQNEPGDSDIALGNFLTSLYHEKDELMDYHAKHHEFPGIKKEFKPRITPLINLAVWSSIVYSGLIYIIVSSLIRGYTWVLVTVLTLLIATAISSIILVRSTRAKCGSAYGSKKSE